MSKNAALRVEVSSSSQTWVQREKRIVSLCRRWVREIIQFAKTKLPRQHFLNKSHDGIEVSVVLASDARVRTLNRIYRGKNKATNVLSFPAVDDTKVMRGPLLLGDIILAFETTRREATAERKSFKAHTAHLVVHGVLHLLGYDHERERDALKMERLERQIMSSLGFADPYAGTIAVKTARAPHPQQHTHQR